MLEKSPESPLDSKEIKAYNSKGNQPWIFIGKTNAESEPLILWPPDAKSWPIGKDPDERKDWRQEKKGMMKDEMDAWSHRFNGHEFEQTLGESEGKGSMECCSLWGCKELDWVIEQQHVSLEKCTLNLSVVLNQISWLQISWNISLIYIFELMKF